MNIIFFSRREGRARHFNLAHPFAVAAFAAVLVAILATAFSLGFKIGESKAPPRGVASWTATLAEQQAEIKELKAELQRRVDAVAMRIGQMNAHVIRLDALGKRLTQMANIDNREFDFESQPAVGGPESDIGAAMQAPDLNSMLNGLEQKISSRDAQLAALENALLSKKLDEQIRPDGRPVRAGHISSYFGERQDPFNGHQAFHKGIDFASPAGSEVIAVAAGVVTFSGEKTGTAPSSRSAMAMAWLLATATIGRWRSAWAARLPAVTSWPSSAPRAARLVRTSTSKFSRTAGRSTR